MPEKKPSHHSFTAPIVLWSILYIWTPSKMLFLLVLNILSQVTGSWNIKFPSANFKFVINGGKISIGGQSITLQPSTDTNYPTSQGWLSFTFNSKTYFVKITTSGVQMITLGPGGAAITGGVTQVTPQEGGGGITVGGGVTVEGGAVTTIPSTSEWCVCFIYNHTLQHQISFSFIFYIFHLDNKFYPNCPMSLLSKKSNILARIFFGHLCISGTYV